MKHIKTFESYNNINELATPPIEYTIPADMNKSSEKPSKNYYVDPKEKSEDDVISYQFI